MTSERVKFALVVAGALVFSWFCVMMGWDEAHAQQNGAQQQIEQTIGSLIVRNAQCSSQVLALQSKVSDLEKRLAAKATVTAPAVKGK